MTKPAVMTLRVPRYDDKATIAGSRDPLARKGCGTADGLGSEKHRIHRKKPTRMTEESMPARSRKKKRFFSDIAANELPCLALLFLFLLVTHSFEKSAVNIYSRNGQAYKSSRLNGPFVAKTILDMCGQLEEVRHKVMR